MSEAEGTVTQAKGLLKSPRGKAIAAVLAGGLVYLWWARSQSSAGSGVVDPTATTTTDRVPPTTGGGGGGTVDSTPADARPQDNQAWLSQCVSVLSAPPYNYDSGTVYNALRLALDGQPLTQAQQTIVSLALSIKGSPPEGMPPTNVSPPAGGGTPPPTNVTPFQEQAQGGEHVEAFNGRVRDKLGHLPNWPLLEATNPTLPLNINWVKDINARTFKKNAIYTIPNGA